MPAKWTHRFQLKPGRWVFNPSPEARAEGAEVKVHVEPRWEPPAYFFHLRRGGHVAALRQHAQHNHFLKADISNFFGSISRSRLHRALKTFFSHVEARRMATASTVKHPKDATTTILPYGFVQSPLLSSLVLNLSSLGAYLDELYKDKTLAVTVYVDDIIVSGDDLAKLQAVSEKLAQRIEKSGFVLSASKSVGPASAITAFNIELEAGKDLTLVEKRLLELKDLIATSDSDCKKAGLLGYVRSVNPDQAKAIEST